MDESGTSWFSECLPSLCLKSLPLPSTQAKPRVSSSFSNMLALLSATVKAILPRRRLEPTGPFVLLLDMLLSLFVSRGACRSLIDRLPLEIVGDTSSISPAAPFCESPNNANKAVTNDAAGCCSTGGNETEKCAICLGPYELGDPVRRLGCKHAFHAECIDMWLEKRSLCPICKVDPC